MEGRRYTQRWPELSLFDAGSAELSPQLGYIKSPTHKVLKYDYPMHVEAALSQFTAYTQQTPSCPAVK